MMYVNVLSHSMSSRKIQDCRSAQNRLLEGNPTNCTSGSNGNGNHSYRYVKSGSCSFHSPSLLCSQG